MNLNVFTRLFLITLVFLGQACSVQKSRNDVSKTGLFYHNLTAKYNGYFNAKELLDLSEDALVEQYRDNYTRILELYEYNGVENAATATANLDIAVKKASTVINLHRPSHWIPDSYLLIGQAQYFKQDYVTAEETFKYMVQNYQKLHVNTKANPKEKAAKERAAKAAVHLEKREEAIKVKEDLKKTQEKERKVKLKTREQQNKEKEKARKQLIKDRKKGIKTSPATKKPTVATKPKSDSSGIKTSVPTKPVDKPKKEEEEKKKEDPPKSKKNGKHKPVLQDAQLWLAKTYIMRKNSIAAGILLKQLKSDPDLYDHLRPEVPILLAYNHIREGEHEDAVPYLQEALGERGLSNARKAKLSFVLGQLQDRLHQDAASYDAFTNVLDYNPNYEMEFFARLMSAQKGMSAGKKDKAQLLEELRKMTKDDKNADFGTAIYHTMAMVSLADKHRAEAKDYLIKGLALGGDEHQKTESFYLLASLYNEDEDYLRAKNYFDSTLAVMGEKDIRKEEVARYSASLTDIAKNIAIIELQDSLLLISSWAEKDQKQWARKLLKDREKTQGSKVLSPTPASFDPSAFTRSNIDLTPQGGNKAVSTFFAYDDKILKKGIKDFEKIWGATKLQDNWRLSQKQGGFTANTNFNSPDAGVTPDQAAESTEDIASILKEIPNTPGAKDGANEKIKNSMYELGVLYREKLENYSKAIKVLEDLLIKYPASMIEQDVLYQIYLASVQSGDQTRTTKYKSRLLAEYPSSKYAQLLNDPNWMLKNEDKAAMLRAFYNETYSLFTSGHCDVVQVRIRQADSLFTENPLRGKFALLDVFCIGKTQGKDAYVNALKDFIARYPQSEERDKAKDMLRYLMGDDKAFETADIIKTNVSVNAFDYLADELHYVIAIVYDKKESTLSDIKISISDFNQRYFQNDDLKISNIFLDQDATIPIIMVRKFDQADQAIRYYNIVKNNPKQFIAPEINHELFAISQSNYRKLYASKDVDSYKSFFKTHYQK